MSQVEEFQQMKENGIVYHVRLDSGRVYSIHNVGNVHVLAYMKYQIAFVDKLVQSVSFGGVKLISAVYVLKGLPLFWLQTIGDKVKYSGWQRTPAEAMKRMFDKVGFEFARLNKGDAAKAFGITSPDYATKLFKHPDLANQLKSIPNGHRLHNLSSQITSQSSPQSPHSLRKKQKIDLPVPSEADTVERLNTEAKKVGFSVNTELYKKGKAFADEALKDVPCDEKTRQLIASLACYFPGWHQFPLIKQIVASSVELTHT